VTETVSAEQTKAELVRRRIRRGNAALRRAEERLQHAREGIVMRDIQIRALRARIAQLEQAHADELTALLSSTSWRVTAPLRRMITRLRGRR
jgi:hypothetical protein